MLISQAVIDEISQGDADTASLRIEAVSGIPVVSMTDQAASLARKLLSENAVPKGRFVDALNIAIATQNGADYILTWNFKHINNVQTKARITQIISEAGLTCPILCSPENLLGKDMTDDPIVEEIRAYRKAFAQAVGRIR